MFERSFPFLATDDGGGIAAVGPAEAADAVVSGEGTGEPTAAAEPAPGGPATVGGDSDADEMATMAKSVLERLAADAKPVDVPRGTLDDAATRQAAQAAQAAQAVRAAQTAQTDVQQQRLPPEVAQYLIDNGWGHRLRDTDPAVLLDIAREIRRNELTMTSATASVGQQQEAARAYQERLEQLNQGDQIARQEAALREYFGPEIYARYVQNPDSIRRADFEEGPSGDAHFFNFKANHKFGQDIQQLHQYSEQRLQGMGQHYEQQFAEQQKINDDLRKQVQAIQQAEHERMLAGVERDLLAHLQAIEKDFPDVFADSKQINLLGAKAGASMKAGEDYTDVFPNMSRMEAALRYHAQSLGYAGLRARERNDLTGKLRANAASSSAHRADSRVAASRGPKTFREITAEKLEEMRKQGVDVPDVPAEFLRDDPDRPD